MTLLESCKLCFAYNYKNNTCRCLNELYCKNGNGHNCKFYKPRDDESNNQKMREFTLRNKKYKDTKTIYTDDTQELKTQQSISIILKEINFE